MTGSLDDGVRETGDRSPNANGPASDDGRERILLPVGHSDEHRIGTLARTAAEVAGTMQASVRVLHVFTPDRFDGAVERLDRDAPGPDDLVRRVGPVRDLTAELAPPLRNWGMTMDVEGRVGEPVSDEVVAAARELDAKRIVVGGRRRTPVGKVVFGSTVQEILLDAPCPVTFVRDDPGT